MTAPAWAADAIVTPAAPPAWKNDEIVGAKASAAPQPQAQAPGIQPQAEAPKPPTEAQKTTSEFQKWAMNRTMSQQKGDQERLGSMAAIADMAIQFPATVVSSLLGAVTGVEAAIQGKSHEDVQKIRRQGTEEFLSASMFGVQNPIHKMMEKAGYTEGYDKSAVMKVMSGFQGWAGNAGDWMEKATGGFIGKGDTEDLINSAINFAVPAAAKLVKGAKGMIPEKELTGFNRMPRYTYDPLVELPPPEHPAGAGRGTQGMPPEGTPPGRPALPEQRTSPEKQPATPVPPVPEEVTPAPLGAMSRATSIDVPSRVIGDLDFTRPGAMAPHVEAAISGLRAVMASPVEAAAAFPELFKAEDMQKAKDRQIAKDLFNFKNTDQWTKTGDQKGSNVGGVYTAPDGSEYYVKTPQSEAHTRNELLAGHLYDLAGVSVARTHEVTHGGKSSVASLMEPNVKAGATADTPGIKEGFAVDAWLANHDVAGLAFDNIHTDMDGKAFRLDLGGALEYRAQGAPKSLSQMVHEFDSMRDPIKAPQAAKLFGKMTDEELIASIQKVQDITPDQIEALVLGKGPKDPAKAQKLADILIARRADLIKRKYQLEKKLNKVARPVTPAFIDHFPPPDYSQFPSHAAQETEKGVGALGSVHKTLPVYSSPEFPKWLKSVMAGTNFRRWFGELGKKPKSVIVDDNGHPLVHYHVTNADFAAFKSSTTESVGATSKGQAHAKTGIFSSPSIEQAKTIRSGKYAMPVFVYAANPFDHLNPDHLEALAKKLKLPLTSSKMMNISDGSWSAMETPEFIDAIQDLGHDGYFTDEASGKFKKEPGKGRNIAVWSSTQYKSIYNPGKFSPKKNIYASVLAPIAAAAALAYLSQEKAEAADDVGNRPVDMYEAGLYTLAALGLAALVYKNGGMGKVEMTKSIADPWKPDFTKMLDPRFLGRAFQWTKQAAQADTTFLWQRMKEARKAGVTEALDLEFRNVTENPLLKATLGQHKMDLYNKYSGALLKSIADEMNKILDPAEKQMVWQEIETRVAVNHRAWWDSVMNDASGSGPRGFQKTASAMKDRTVFALADGTIITVKKMAVGDKWKVTGWKNNTRIDLGQTSDRPTKGSDFAGQKVVSAKQIDIEKHTPIRYLQSDLATLSVKLSELRKYNRENEMMKEVLASPGAQHLFVHQKYGQIPPEYTQPEGANSIPALAGTFMPKEYADVITDFIKKNKGAGSIADGVNNILIRAMMINPYPHMMNELVHWYDSRGISGFITPTGIGGASKGLYGMATTLPSAIRSVIVQDKFQLELQKSGGFLLYPATKNQRAWKNILQMSMKRALQTGSLKEMALAIGTTPGKLMGRISDGSAGLMWAVRDIMYTQLVKEQMLMGKTMNEAATEVGKHMPEYYIPARIISKGPVGRIASRIVSSPINIFAHYHYGMMRALKEIGKDIAMGGMKDKLAGLDRAAAIAVALMLILPMIDDINKQVTGTEGEGEAKQRRPGALHILNGIGEVYDGKRDIGSLAVSLFTPNPAIMTAWETIQNHSLYNGKPIRSEGAPADVQAAQTARHLATKISPVQTTDDIYTGRMTYEQYMWKQLDILVKTEEQVKKAEESRQRRKEAGEAAGKRFMEKYGAGD